jgi:uncharacterized protein (TIGR00255 family)
MALSSMTGFARTSFEAEGTKFSWEAKSVNARGLEMRIRLPAGLDHLEADVRGKIRDGLQRGSCFFTLTREAGTEERAFVVNRQALAAVLAAARELAREEGVAPASAAGLLAIPGVLADGSGGIEGDAAERRDAVVLTALSTAIDGLKRARREEGARLSTVLGEQLDSVARLVKSAEEVAAEAPAALRARIREQVSLLTDGTDLNPDRLHQEALIAATRADVREEIDRLNSHIESARGLMRSEDGVGRRLEFLAQEFNREANTLCAKAYCPALTTIGLELKAVIDQFREQVQNLA